MSDTPEPLSAILAEMRADEIETEDGVVRLDDYADRIEAAVGRERNRQYEPKCNWSIKDALALANTLANHGLRDGNADAASSCIYSLCRILSAPGNAAAMRAALEKAHNNIKKAREFIAWQTREDELLMEAQQEIKTALSAPARNCGRFATAEEARDAVKAAFANTMLLDDRQLRAVCDWLFDSAEGGAK